MILFDLKKCSPLIVIICSLFCADLVLSADFTGENKDIINLVKAVKKGQWKSADYLSENLTDPAPKAFVVWAKLREGMGAFDDYHLFLTQYKHWPGLKILSQKGEAKITKETEPEKIIKYFKRFPASTVHGSIYLIEAYEKLNNKNYTVDEIVRAWTKLSMSKSETELFLIKYGKITKPLINDRVDFLLWNGMTANVSYLLPYLNKDQRALAKARIALINQDYGVDQLIQRVPSNLKLDPGLAYDRFLWRLKKGRVEDATKILKQQSLSKKLLQYPDKWSRKRRDYARQAMRDNQPELAYFLASNHFLKNGSDYADLEWLAGYLSLRKLKKPTQAIMHFNNFLNEVRTPISLGRAGYWLGRAYEANGQSQLAKYYYRLGAKNQISFYGQLSAEKIGAKFDKLLISKESDSVNLLKKFNRNDVFRLAVILHQSGEDILAKRFFLHVTNDLDSYENQQVANYLLDINSEFLALAVAKQAASRGQIYPQAYYPLHELVDSNWKVGVEILLAIARRESEFNPRARSGAGARGLMQIMPRTAKKLASDLKLKYSLDRLSTDWRYNAELGAQYLSYLMQKYDGSFLLSFGAYNAGPTRMDKWIKRYGDPRNQDVNYIDWIEHIPFNETRNYIMRVLEGVLIYQAKLNDDQNFSVKIKLSQFD